MCDCKKASGTVSWLAQGLTMVRQLAEDKGERARADLMDGVFARTVTFPFTFAGERDIICL